jgi:16S rRNA (adenine1518-N6/adenine1519-N6)-dimethyltransferase
MNPESNGRPAWLAVRAALEERGFRPSRRLGQNFLLDENMLRAIVRDAELAPDDVALEVGPGCGFLTLHLAPAVRRLVCVEIDARLLGVARELCAGLTNIEWLLADVLADKRTLAPEVAARLPASGAWHLVSNLPYSVSAPLCAVLADQPNPPRSMTVLVQREVAERMAASPGSSDWGPLSIRLALDYVAKIVRPVPAQLFWPRPEVESAVVRLERCAEPVAPAERVVLMALVQALFQRRRQGLGRVLREFAGRARAEELLPRLGLDPRARAEDLPLATLRALARELERGRADVERETPPES